jgi:hypothetical protein
MLVLWLTAYDTPINFIVENQGTYYNVITVLNYLPRQ